MKAIIINNIINGKYHNTEKHNLDINDYRYDRHWSDWKPNKKEIEKNTWLKVNINIIKIRWHTHYVLDFNINKYL
jgi:hypothetical protein